jgi:hypothetical protein
VSLQAAQRWLCWGGKQSVKRVGWVNN